MPAGNAHRLEPMSSTQSMLRPVSTVPSSAMYSARVHALAGLARGVQSTAVIATRALALRRSADLIGFSRLTVTTSTRWRHLCRTCCQGRVADPVLLVQHRQAVVADLLHVHQATVIVQ